MTIQYVNTLALANYVSSLTVVSVVGYRISGNDILGPKPYIATTSTLNGLALEFSDSGQATRLLEVVESQPQGMFLAQLGSPGVKKLITMTNRGNSDLIVGQPVFSNRNTVASPRYLAWSRPPWTLTSGTSRAFYLSYSGLEQGTFYESIFFPTPNSVLNYYRLDTQVSVKDPWLFTLTPTSYTTSTYRINENSVVSYRISALKQGLVDPSYSVPVTVQLQGHSSWSIDVLGDNRVDLRFSSRGLALTTASYVSTLTIVTENTTFVTVNTATHSVNTLLNLNQSSWFSDLIYPDAVVAMRMDLVQTGVNSTETTRTVTIGVGSGGDGAPRYKDGGGLYFDVANLAPMEGTAKEPWAYFRTVYQIPLATTAASYLSNDYRVKSQEPQTKDYDWYFGQGDDLHSMFTVVQDNLGNVNVNMNELRELTTGTDYDAELNLTLDRLTRAFYYYVIDDAAARPNQSSQYRLNEFGQVDALGTDTRYFLGFDSNGLVQTSLVKIPR